MRRYFFQAIQLNRKDLLALGIVAEIDKLFELEAEAKAAGLGAAERLGLRGEKAEPIVEGLKERIESLVDTRYRFANTSPGSYRVSPSSPPDVSANLHQPIGTAVEVEKQSRIRGRLAPEIQLAQRLRNVYSGMSLRTFSPRSLRRNSLTQFTLSDKNSAMPSRTTA